jgi:hypothetical protein
VVPTASIADGLATPDSGRTIKVEIPVGITTAAMFNQEMGIQQDRLDLGKRAVLTVDMIPASLDHTHLVIGKIVNCAHQNIWVGHKVRIKNGNIFTATLFKAIGKSSCLETGAVHTLDVGDVETLFSVALDLTLGKMDGFVGGIIQYLDFQAILGVVNPTHRVDQAVHHKLLVVNGKLYRDHR